jgi:zinc/manganese transport system permease protein
VHFLFEPGLFSSGPVRTAALVGVITAVVSATVGVFTVIRSQSFAGHALTDVATTGGSAAYYLGLAPLVGFIGGGALGAGAMEVAGVERVRSRDVATGVVLGAATGLAALFLYLDTTTTATTGATQQILFGSIFTVEPSTIPVVAAFGAIVLFVLGGIRRPLLLSSLSPELAAARGIRVRRLGLVFMLTMAVAVGLSSIAIGSILSTALLIGPAATALRITRSLRGSVIAAGVIGIAATLLGIVLAYDSSYWEPSTQGLPVSFFIVAITFAAYLVSGLPIVRRLARPRSGYGDEHERRQPRLAATGPGETV